MFLRNPSTRFHANQQAHESNLWRYGNRRRYREETASVIRFNFMCAHSINRPAAQSRTRSYAVTCCEPSLPVQNDGGIVTCRTGEANVEKCLRSEIRT